MMKELILCNDGRINIMYDVCVSCTGFWLENSIYILGYHGWFMDCY